MKSLNQLNRKLARYNTLLGDAAQSKLTKAEIYGIVAEIYKLEAKIEAIKAAEIKTEAEKATNKLVGIKPLNSGSKKFYWVSYSPRIAQIRSTGFAAVTYIHFADEIEAARFCTWIKSAHQLDCQARKATRFSDGWECKIKNIPALLLADLIAKDTQKPVEYQLLNHCNSNQPAWIKFYPPMGVAYKLEPSKITKSGHYYRTSWNLDKIGYYTDSQGRFFYISSNQQGILELHYCDEFGAA